MEESTKDCYVDCLKQYQWNWVCTLQVRNRNQRKTARRLFREWITRLEEIEGHRLSWALMVGFNGTSGMLQCQGFVAGVVRATPDRAESIWLRMAGDAEIDRFSSGWLEYLLKDVEDTDRYDFDLHLEDDHLFFGLRPGAVDLPAIRPRRNW